MKILTPQILAMYLGCVCRYVDEDKNEMIAPLLAVNLQGFAWFVDPEFDEAIEIKDIKPILRNLSSMTEKEARELYDVVIGSWEGGIIKSKRFGKSMEVICYDIDEDDNPSDDEIFEDADNNETLLRIDLAPFNIWKGREHDYNEVYDWKTHVDIFACLLSKHFDLFGLIESGLAIDKDALK